MILLIIIIMCRKASNALAESNILTSSTPSYDFEKGFPRPGSF